MAAAAALEAGLLREFADNGHLLPRPQRQHVPLVLQQYHALRRQFPGQLVILLLIPGRVRLGVVVVFLIDPQDPLHAGVHVRLRDPAFPHRPEHLPVVNAAGGGHLQIHARQDSRHPVRHGAPVADHVSLKAPFLPQHVRQQPFVDVGVHAVDPVIAAHDGPGLGLFHRGLEARQVDFPQRPLVDLAAGGHPPVLLVVGGEMLQAGAHVPALDALDDAGGHLPRQIGILAHVLKVPPAQGAALDVDGGPQVDGHPFVLALVADGLADRFHQLPVEAAGAGAGRREAHRLDAVVDPQVIRLIVLLPQPVGAVADHDGLHAQALHALRVPEIRSGEQGAFLLQGHL